MNGDTLIDPYAPQFSQREASDIGGVEMTTINNWLLRGDFKLTLQEGRRRLFSIADIAAVHTMNACVRLLDTRPEAASFAGDVVREFYRAGPRETDEFKVWHIIKRDTFSDGGWRAQAIWQDRKSGAFYHYHPGIFGRDEPFGFPHFPCVSLPTSDLANRMFLACADRLIDEDTPVPKSPEGQDTPPASDDAGHPIDGAPPK